MKKASSFSNLEKHAVNTLYYAVIEALWEVLFGRGSKSVEGDITYEQDEVTREELLTRALSAGSQRDMV